MLHSRYDRAPSASDDAQDQARFRLAVLIAAGVPTADVLTAALIATHDADLDACGFPGPTLEDGV